MIANAMLGDQGRAIAVRMSNYLRKPVGKGDLAQMMTHGSQFCKPRSS